MKPHMYSTNGNPRCQARIPDMQLCSGGPTSIDCSLLYLVDETIDGRRDYIHHSAGFWHKSISMNMMSVDGIKYNNLWGTGRTRYNHEYLNTYGRYLLA